MYNRKLLLLFVIYKPSFEEVAQLIDCLSSLPEEIGYGVAVNSYDSNISIAKLLSRADLIQINKDNPGYGVAINQLFEKINELPAFIGAINQDIKWLPGTFENILKWLQSHNDVVLAVPKILNNSYQTQKLCKRNPTLLTLFSRRFIPNSIKPRWLKDYDNWYIMDDSDYENVFDVPYLSGCCMIISSAAFANIGGFDERFFLYLEDA